MDQHENATTTALVDRLVRRSDVAIFECPCCGQSIGVQRNRRVRRHFHRGGGRKCWFSGVIPNDRVQAARKEDDDNRERRGRGLGHTALFSCRSRKRLSAIFSFWLIVASTFNRWL